jgi:hypothetical protein
LIKEHERSMKTEDDAERVKEVWWNWILIIV